MDKTISAPDLSELCGIALYGDAVNKPVGIRDKQTFLLGVRTNLKSYNPTAPDAVLPALACGPEAQNSICIVEINETGDAYHIVWGLENGGRLLRQMIMDDNLRDIGRDFGVTLNEEILNFKFDDEMYC